VIVALVRYPSEAAILRMVDAYEQTGEKVGFKAGWKLGWTRRAFRMWVIDLVIGLPVLLYLAVVLGLTGMLIFNVIVQGEAQAAFPVIATFGGIMLLTIPFVLGMVFLGLLRQFFVRKAALEEATVGESFRQGWAMFKRNWKSGGLMWLVMLGIGIAYGIASIIVFFLLIPAYVILLVPAGVAAAIPGLIVYAIANLFTDAILSAIIAAVLALPLFFTVLFAPLALIGGWYLIFESSVWTLTYREMKALEAVSAPPVTPA
jgi:hypothetical protein